MLLQKRNTLQIDKLYFVQFILKFLLKYPYPLYINFFPGISLKKSHPSSATVFILRWCTVNLPTVLESLFDLYPIHQHSQHPYGDDSPSWKSIHVVVSTVLLQRETLPTWMHQLLSWMHWVKILCVVCGMGEKKVPQRKKNWHGLHSQYTVAL